MLTHPVSTGTILGRQNQSDMKKKCALNHSSGEVIKTKSRSPSWNIQTIDEETWTRYMCATKNETSLHYWSTTPPQHKTNSGLPIESLKGPTNNFVLHYSAYGTKLKPPDVKLSRPHQFRRTISKKKTPLQIDNNALKFG